MGKRWGGGLAVFYRVNGGCSRREVGQSLRRSRSRTCKLGEEPSGEKRGEPVLLTQPAGARGEAECIEGSQLFTIVSPLVDFTN